MFNKFTNRLQKVLERAHGLADFGFRKKVEIEDIFLSLAYEKGCMAYEILNRSGLQSETLNGISPKTGVKVGQETVFTQQVNYLLEKSVALAADLEHVYVGTEHLLYILVHTDDKKIQEILHKNKINTKRVKENLEIIFATESSFSLFDQGISEMFGQDAERLFDQMAGGINSIDDFEVERNGNFLTKIKDIKKNKSARLKNGSLQFFARDLTDKNLQDGIDPVIGREKEINRIIQIISRRTKNNPILLGDPGVGKTAIVEGLGKKILQGSVPEVLLDKKIYSLDINMLVAGTVMRGEFELRLKKVIDEVKANSNAILFIDEIHTIVGAGNAGSGAIDAANILKPALARGEIRCIGATTFEDYKKYIEDDPALERRFQPVSVSEPSADEALAMLKGIKQKYEEHHQVEITEQAIETAVELSVRYIPERFLPDKAIDLIDEAAARLKVGVGISEKQSQIRLLESKLADLIEQKIKFVELEKYPEAIKVKQDELKLMQEIFGLKKLQENRHDLLGKITGKEIASVVSEMKHIPVEELSSNEGKHLARLEKDLKKYIIGQDEAMRDLAFFVKRGRAGFSSANRPLGSFILLGPSGVGKTETAKVLASEVFGSEDKLIRIDMSEFSESFNISRLIGSPPGYVGFKEGGKLTEKVKHKPYSVVLFDEIEKAHPQVLNLLLQIMEDGHLTDAAGKKVSFKNTIVLMTSNLGLADIGKGSIGFDFLKNKTADAYEKIKDKALAALKDKLNPEFINRVDKILVYNTLSLEVVEKIVSLELERIQNNLKIKKIKLNFDRRLVHWIAKKSFSLEFGARQVRRVIQEEVENLLVDKILTGEIQNNTVIKLGEAKGKVFIK
ncbi:MAG: ATP-dependent Clp protease ATP-binding subunit [Patescibacteria group bacterium]